MGIYHVPVQHDNPYGSKSTGPLPRFFHSPAAYHGRGGRQIHCWILTLRKKFANRYIFDKNRALLPLNMSEAQYNPLRFPQSSCRALRFYLQQDRSENPCDKDRFTISVDSLTVQIIGYDRRWNSPDSAFSVTVDPLITRSGATFAILKKARKGTRHRGRTFDHFCRNQMERPSIAREHSPSGWYPLSLEGIVYR